MKQNFNFYIGLASLSIMFCATIANADPTNKSIEYQKINKLLDLLLNQSKSKFIKARARLSLKSRDLHYKDVELWLSRDNKTIESLSVSKDGEVKLPIYNQQDAQALKLNFNQPEELVSLILSSTVVLPMDKTLKYTKLFEVLDDVNNFASEMAGAASWFVPNMDGLAFQFDQAASISIRTNKKLYTYNTDDDLLIEIDRSKRLMKQNPLVTLSHLPVSMTPID